MATALNSSEQEQLDQLKDFWKRYGNLITWVLILALGGFAAFQGWQRYQVGQATKAAVLYDELDKAVQALDADKAARVFADIQERYPSTTYAAQAGLLASKLQFDLDRKDAARASLDWVAAEAAEKEYRIVAQLRLAGMLLDDKKYDEALARLPVDAPPAFAALVADRRGDILLAQDKTDEARAAFKAAYDAMDPTLDYRRLVEAKLTALGGAAAAAPAAAGASK